jgi:hypothetical protein
MWEGVFFRIHHQRVAGVMSEQVCGEAGYSLLRMTSGVQALERSGVRA